MKKIFIIAVVLLFSLAAILIGLIVGNTHTSPFSVLGIVTNNSTRYVILNVTNATSGKIAMNPYRSLVFTSATEYIATPLVRPTKWTGFQTVVNPATNCIFEVPIPAGAVRWSLEFNMTFQTPLTRIKDVLRKPKPGVTGEFTSFGSPKRLSTGDLPP